MPLLLKMDSWVEPLFQSTFHWEFKCSQCKTATKERYTMKWMIKNYIFYLLWGGLSFLKLAERSEKVFMLGTNASLTIAVGLEPTLPQVCFGEGKYID